MKKIETIISSPPDRENLVAEIWIDDQMIAEINQETDALEIEIYYMDKEKLNFKYDEFINALKKAKEKLTEGVS